MNSPLVIFTLLAPILLQATVTAQTCTVQPIFPTNFPNPNPLVCDGDAGGTQISVFANSIEFKLLGGFPDPVPGFPGKQTPNGLNLVIVRRANGEVNRRKSFVMLNSRRFTYGNSASDRKKFRKYFNILQVFVRQFETGNCPIDGGQGFPELAAVRGSLLSLASIFRVKDCSGGNTM